MIDDTIQSQVSFCRYCFKPNLADLAHRKKPRGNSPVISNKSKPHEATRSQCPWSTIAKQLHTTATPNSRCMWNSSLCSWQMGQTHVTVTCKDQYQLTKVNDLSLNSGRFQSKMSICFSAIIIKDGQWQRNEAPTHAISIVQWSMYAQSE